MLRLVLAFVLSLLAALPARAERRVALVFGADAYVALRPLENGVRDAVRIAEMLRGLGFEVVLETDRDLRRMRRALEDFVAEGIGADVALVYWAGHGAEIAGDNRLLPVDADTASLEALLASSLPLEEVRAAAARVAKTVLILVDACRDDPFGEGSGPTGARSGRPLAPSIRAAVGPGMGRMGRAENTLFAFAAAPGTTAIDGTGDASPFAAALARYLGTPGIEIRSALTLVQQQVYDATGGRQLPYIESGLPRLFFATVAAGELAERERLLLAMAGLSEAVRADVEAIARLRGVPLAPLYGAVIAAGLDRVSASERHRALDQAALAFDDARTRLGLLSSGDPEVARLRTMAEQHLGLGALAEARAALDRAVEIDAASRGTLAGNLVARTLSEAASLDALAGVAMTALDRPAAIAALERADRLHAGIAGLEVSDSGRKARVDLLRWLTGLYASNGPVELSLDAAERMIGAAQTRIDALTAQGQLGDGPAMLDLAIAHGQRAIGHRALGRVAAAAADYAEARHRLEDLVALMPEFVEAQRMLALYAGDEGELARSRGDITTATDAFRRSLEIAEMLMARHPERVDLKSDLVAALFRMGDAWRAVNDYVRAEADYTRARNLAQELVALRPGEIVHLRDLAEAERRIGKMQRNLGHKDRAAEHYRAALAVQDKVALADPDNTLRQIDMVETLILVAEAEWGEGDGAGAVERLGRAAAIAERVRVRDPLPNFNHDLLARALMSRAEIGAMIGRRDQAVADLDRARDLLERLVAAEPENEFWLGHLGRAHVGYANMGVDTLEHVSVALDIYRRMMAAGQLTAQGGPVLIAQLEAWQAALIRGGGTRAGSTADRPAAAGIAEPKPPPAAGPRKRR